MATLPVESVSQAGESEGVIDNPMLNESTVMNFVSKSPIKLILHHLLVHLGNVGILVNLFIGIRTWVKVRES